MKATFENGLAELEKLNSRQGHVTAKVHLISQAPYGMTIACHPTTPDARLVETVAQDATCKMCLAILAREQDRALTEAESTTLAASQVGPR